MILFSQRHSPYARKAEVALLEAGLTTIEVRHLADHVSQGDTPAYEENPLNAAPLLILDDGRGVFDSEEICFYIDEFSGGALVPKSSDARQEAMIRQRLATGLCEIGADLRWELQQNQTGISVPGLREDLIFQLSAAYDILENGPVMGKIPPDQPADIGTIALATALDWLTFRSLDAYVLPHPNLVWWVDTFRDRPSMTATEYEDLSEF
ncbi:MAG: glutathione S-transferase [Thalassobaculaceae bacterium]|nr:glutathione S-transferase [Thalassobaculaceae bacterium]